MANGTPTRAVGEYPDDESRSLEARVTRLEQQAERITEMLELILKYYEHHAGAKVLAPRTLAKLESDIAARVQHFRAAAA